MFITFEKAFADLLFAENERIARIYFLIGNDLETSEILYSTSFCINSKERYSECKGNIIF